MRYIFLLLAFTLISCTNDTQVSRFDVEGYYCGDSIKRDLAYEDYDPTSVDRLVIDKDSNLWFSAQKGYITEMVCFSLNNTEIDSITKRINSLYGILPIDSINKYGTDIRYWYDSVSGDQIRIYFGSDSLSTLIIDNPKVDKWVFENYPLEDPEYDFTPLSDE